MMRYALGIEYDGSGFYGWQRQREEPTVQGVLESALTKVANHSVQVACAGRTDTGVHAWEQVAHFDTASERNHRSWLLGINSNLPPGVSVRWIHPVEDEFHARFSALGRRYQYIILNRWVAPAIESGRVSWYRKPLDENLMHEAGQLLVGEHDFSSFRSAGCKANHPVRDLHDLTVSREGDRVVIDIAANGFLYHMVRNVAGSLMMVGSAERTSAWFAEVFAARDRKLAGITASPDGLYFCSVRYPDKFGLPDGPQTYPEGYSDGR